MPSLNKRRLNYLPDPPKPFENAKRSDHVRKNRWTKASKRYRMQHPLCEVSDHYGIVAEAQHVDHIIRVQDGGAQYDTRNLMSITADLHNYKTGREQHTPVMVEWEYNEDGDKIPKNREDVYRIYEAKFEGRGG